MQICYLLKGRYNLHGELVNPQLRTYDEVNPYFDTVLDTWSKSNAFDSLKAILQPVLPQCSKIVAFALGDFSRAIKTDHDNGCACQDAMLLTLRDMMMSHYADAAEDMACFAQDPAYNDVDQAVLEQHGVRVVEDPAGFLEVDNFTAVISISPDVAVRGIVADLAYPALIIWNELPDESRPPVML